MSKTFLMQFAARGSSNLMSADVTKIVEDALIEHGLEPITSKVSGMENPENATCGAQGEDGRGNTAVCGLDANHEGDHDWWNMPKAEFIDPNPWYRTVDSEMPDAPSWERYATESNHTEFKPRTLEEYEAEGGAVRG